MSVLDRACPIASWTTAASLADLGLTLLAPARCPSAGREALALNGRADEAEHELAIIKGVHHPALFARIDADWRAWKDEHRAELTAAP